MTAGRCCAPADRRARRGRRRPAARCACCGSKPRPIRLRLLQSFPARRTGTCTIWCGIPWSQPHAPSMHSLPWQHRSPRLAALTVRGPAPGAVGSSSVGKDRRQRRRLPPDVLLSLEGDARCQDVLPKAGPGPACPATDKGLRMHGCPYQAGNCLLVSGICSHVTQAGQVCWPPLDDCHLCKV